MAKRRKNSRLTSWRWPSDINISPETKHSIGVIFVLLLATLMILGLFDLAGLLGGYLEKFLKIMFGQAYYVVPFILFGLGILMIDPERFGLRASHYFGLVLLVLSVTGLLHLRREVIIMTWPEVLDGLGGGYVGWFVVTPFFKIMGFWATLVVLVALFLVAVVLTFNTSLKSFLAKIDALRYFGEKLSSWWYHWRHRDYYTVSKELEAEETGEEEEEEDEDEAEEQREDVERPVFTQKGLAASSGEQQRLMTVPASLLSIKLNIPMQLLDSSRSKPTSGDIQANKEKIKKTLENFGIEVEMGEVSVGPTVTQYTLRPQEGVKLSSITALHNDLALALAAHPIRIEAPIPGKALVGIEVPNQSIATVTLREVIDSKEFKEFQSQAGRLALGIGKDVAGRVWTADLDKMPHLLIAGATGSGKSVCINSIIISLLYQKNPDELKFILIDPKRVELSVYNDLPYLLTPVITDVQKIINALKWTVAEMDERYVRLAQRGQKNIAGYNAAFPEQKMPYIVIIIDELADLMAVAAQEVEGAVIRLAQMARAVGIHLILATQRPSVNVITGLIKANITSRIAFAVASQTDSRTIIDLSGAEKLLGRGDMLFISAEISKPKRLQAAFLSEAEISRVCGYIKKQAGDSTEYDSSITQRPRRDGQGLELSGEDDMLDEARRLVVSTQKASASYLQRRLRVGYSRAARLLDLLEEEGVIGEAEGAKPREVLVSAGDYEAVEAASQDDYKEGEISQAEDDET